MLLIDKPQDWTSFDVVNKVRGLIRRKLGVKKIKVGHAGTLDPLATGLLIICTGRLTRQMNQLMDLDKEYTGTIRLGATTPSYDAGTAVDMEFSTEHITPEDVLKAAKRLTGTYDQVPPVYSAKKIAGRRAYEYARKQQEVIMPPARITIHEFDIPRIEIPEVDFRVHCSKGTYIRSLARDLGEALDIGAYLYYLRRTKIGPYKVDDAISLVQFEALLI